jgi:hypothetical protein
MGAAHFLAFMAFMAVTALISFGMSLRRTPAHTSVTRPRAFW